MLGQPTLPESAEILLGILVAVAAYDVIRFRRIPNGLVLSGIIAGFTWNSLSSGGFLLDDPGLLRAGKGPGLGFILYFPLYLIRGRRAGDVKLLAAAGSITGPGNCFWLFLLTALLGGLIALAVVAIHKRAGRIFSNVVWILRDIFQFKAPYMSSPERGVMAVGAGAFILLSQNRLAVS